IAAHTFNFRVKHIAVRSRCRTRWRKVLQLFNVCFQQRLSLLLPQYVSPLTVLWVGVTSKRHDTAWQAARRFCKVLGLRMHFAIGLAECLIQDVCSRTLPSFYVRVIVRQRDYLLLQTFYLTLQESYCLVS